MFALTQIEWMQMQINLMLSVGYNQQEKTGCIGCFSMVKQLPWLSGFSQLDTLMASLRIYRTWISA